MYWQKFYTLAGENDIYLFGHKNETCIILSQSKMSTLPVSLPNMFFILFFFFKIQNSKFQKNQNFLLKLKLPISTGLGTILVVAFSNNIIKRDLFNLKWTLLIWVIMILPYLDHQLYKTFLWAPFLYVK